MQLFFLDYSSAFNTIRPGKLIEKLTNLGVPTPTCKWIFSLIDLIRWGWTAGSLGLNNVLDYRDNNNLILNL